MRGVSWLGVDELIAPLRPLVRHLSPDAPLRQAGAAVVSAHYGDALFDHPALVNVGVLAVQSRGAPATYFTRPSASRVVHETDLHSIPAEPPPLLRAPGIIQARRPETGERLWGDVASLGWYQIDGTQMEPRRLIPAIFLIGVLYPDGIFVARWSPAWTGDDLIEQLPYAETNTSLIETVEAATHHEFAKQAARYLTIFGLLEQVENGPLRFELDKVTRIRQVKMRDLSARGMKAGPPLTRVEPLTSLDPATRVLAETIVRGHLKRTRVGEGRKRIRWDYIHGYSARRWFAPRFTVERDHVHGGLANASLVYQPMKR